MARQLTASERRQVWEKLERRLGSLSPEPVNQSGLDSRLASDHNAYPIGFQDRHLLSAQYLPDETLLSAIKQAMERLGEPALFFLASEFGQGDELNGLEWEVPLSELTYDKLAEISPVFECYLYSTHDNWAIYFHHEGFAFCGGIPAFVDVIKANCPSLDVRLYPGLADG